MGLPSNSNSQEDGAWRLGWGPGLGVSGDWAAKEGRGLAESCWMRRGLNPLSTTASFPGPGPDLPHPRHRFSRSRTSLHPRPRVRRAGGGKGRGGKWRARGGT